MMNALARSCVLLVGLLLPGTVTPSVSGAGVSTSIDNFLVEAQEALTRTAAEEKLSEAQRLLQTQQTVDQDERFFLGGRIDRERAAICLKFWQRDRQQAGWRDEARRTLEGLESRYRKQCRAWEAQCQKLEARKEKDLSGRQVMGDPRYQKLTQNVARVRYEMAWTEFWLAVTSDSPSEKRQFLESASGKFHDVTVQGYRKESAEAFHGHALCLYYSGEYSRLERLIAKLDVPEIRSGEIPPYLRKKITLLRVKVALADGLWSSADRFATEYFDRLEAPALDDVELEIAVAWATGVANMTAHLAPGATSKSFQRTCEQVRAAGGPWPGRLARALGDSRLSSLQRAKEAFEAKDFEKALAQAAAGLKGSTTPGIAEITSVDADLCYVKFAALWNLRRWGEAHLTGMAFLKEHGVDRHAPEVCRKAVRSGLNALGSPPPALTPAQFQQNLDFLEKHWPAVAEVRTGRRDAARIFLGMRRLGDAESILRTIAPGSSTYGWAQYDLAEVLCVLYQQAGAGVRAGNGPTKQASAWLRDSGAALIGFAGHPGARSSEPNAPSAKDMETLAVAVAGELLRHRPPDPNLALKVLEGMGRLPQVGGSDKLQALSIEANVLAGNVDVALALAASFPAELWASKYVEGACLRVVSALEERAGSRADRGRPAEAERISEQVVTLLQLLLARPEPSQPNGAESSRLRLHLAETLTRLGRYEEAARHYTWVMEHSAAENAGPALRGLATAYERDNKYDQALLSWQTLYARLKPRTSEWVEAACHHILCLLKTGKTQEARQLMAYFKLQAEGMDLGPWAAQLETLERECANAAAGANP